MKDGRIEGKPPTNGVIYSNQNDLMQGNIINLVRFSSQPQQRKTATTKRNAFFSANFPKAFKQKPEKWPQTWKKCGERLKDSEEFFNSQSWLENLRETSLHSFMVRFWGDDVRSPTITCMKSKQFPVPGSLISSHLAQRRRKLQLPRC